MERVMGELVMDKNEFGDALMMGHDMDVMVLGDSTGWSWGGKGFLPRSACYGDNNDAYSPTCGLLLDLR